MGLSLLSLACGTAPASPSSDGSTSHSGGTVATSVGEASSSSASTSSRPDSSTSGSSGPTGSATGTSGPTSGGLTGPIGSISVTIATPIEDLADELVANETPLELCLTATDCFDLVRPHRDDAGKRESGPLQFDVHAHDDVALARESIDRVELRAGVETTWAPSCLAVSVGGEPLLCTRDFQGPLGVGSSFDPDAASGCSSCFERGRDTDLLVTHGPFVGHRDAAAGSARIWLRTDASRDIEVWVGADQALTNARLAATEKPRPEDDFTAELTIDGLAAGGQYYYRVVADGVPHATIEDDPWHPGGVYPLRMPPPTGRAGEFSFATGSCARMFAHGNYDAVRDSDAEFLLSLGDYHYGNVLSVHFEGKDPSRDHRAARDELRWWYRTAHWEKATLFAQMPILNTWDDHDYGGDQTYADREAVGREFSRSTMLEYFANGEDTRNSGPDEATYFRFSYGDADFFVLDARLHRPRLCDVEGGGVACDPGEDPLGPTQTDWLIDGLTASTATFKFIAQGTRIYGGGAKAWTPFLIARDAMLQRIVDANVHGVLFLSGGPHVSEYRQFDAAGRTWHEIVTSPLSSGLGECSGAAGQIECYDEIKNFVQLDVSTTGTPAVTARILTFDGEKAWSDATPTVVLPLSAL